MSLMIQEIFEQPVTLEKTISEERRKVERIAAEIRRRNTDLIVLVARGSSDNASLFGRYLIEILAGIPVSLAAPSVYTLYDARVKLDHATVIGVSQSGEGDDINSVLEECRRSGAYTLGVTNNPESSMVNHVDDAIFLHSGIEKSVAATKTYTGQIMVFHMLANALSESFRVRISEIPRLVELALSLRPSVEEMVSRYLFMENCVVVGRGLIYANAYELALKLMETCYVVAERFSTADFFHGPLAIVERNFPVILFAPAGPTLNGSRELLQKLKDLSADSLVITSDAQTADLSSRSILFPEPIDEFHSTIPFIVPGQLFAACLAESKGLDPDTPRSLSKVTKTL